MAAPAVQAQERLVSTRDQRVACGDDLHVVDVKVGEEWPADAAGRLDVFLRNGFVVRFDENGEPDPISVPFLRRLGFPPQAPASIRRSWDQRARILAQTATIDGKRIRVFPGRPDSMRGDLFIVDGRAYAARRGGPDSPTVGGARRGSARGGANPASRRRPREEGGNGSTPRRRRRKGG